jgi:hypothetical protein
MSFLNHYFGIVCQVPFSNTLILRQVQFIPEEPITTSKDNDGYLPQDKDGYLLRHGFQDSDPTRPHYQLPKLNGAMHGIMLIYNSRFEGFASLWKGFNN